MRFTLDNVHLLTGKKPSDWMMDLSVPIAGDELTWEPTLGEIGEAIAAPFRVALTGLGPLVKGFSDLMRAGTVHKPPSDHTHFEWSAADGDPLEDMRKYAESLKGGKIAPWSPSDMKILRENHIHISASSWMGASPVAGIIDEPYHTERYLAEQERLAIAEEISLEHGTIILKSAKRGVELPKIKKNSGPPKKRMR